MTTLVVTTPEELRNLIHEAVVTGVGSALASLAKSTPKEMNDVEAAEYLGISPGTLRTWRTQKRGPKYHKTGRSIHYSKSDLNTYLKQSEVHTIDSLETGHGTFC